MHILAVIRARAESMFFDALHPSLRHDDHTIFAQRRKSPELLLPGLLPGRRGSHFQQGVIPPGDPSIDDHQTRGDTPGGRPIRVSMKNRRPGKSAPKPTGGRTSRKSRSSGAIFRTPRGEAAQMYTSRRPPRTLSSIFEAVRRSLSSMRASCFSMSLSPAATVSGEA